MDRSDPDLTRIASHVQDNISPFPGELRPPPLKKQCVGEADRTPTFVAGQTNNGSRPSSVENSNGNSKWAEFDRSFQPQSSESAMYNSYMGLNVGIDAAAAHQELFTSVHPGQVQGPSPYPSARSLGSHSDENGLVSTSRISPVPTALDSTVHEPPLTRPHAPTAAGGVSPTMSFAYSEQFKSIATVVSDDSGCSTVAASAPPAANPFVNVPVKTEDVEPYPNEAVKPEPVEQYMNVAAKPDPVERYMNVASKPEAVHPYMHLSGNSEPLHPYMNMAVKPAPVHPYVNVAGRQVDPYVGEPAKPEPVGEPEEKEKKWVRWSEAEDDRLRAAVAAESDPPNWKLISKKYFGGERNEIQCKNRWKKSLQPGLIKGSWTKEEDAIIRNCVSSGMTKWSDIAKRLTGRIGDQVKERWHNSLDPTVKKGMWTAEEVRILHEKQRELGNQWSRIAEFIPGRSENSVKNRWYNEKTSRKRALKRQRAAAATAAQQVQMAAAAAAAQQVPMVHMEAAAATAQQVQMVAAATTIQQEPVSAAVSAEETAEQQAEEMAAEATTTQQV